MAWYSCTNVLLRHRNGTVSSVKEIVSNLNNANLDPSVGTSAAAAPLPSPVWLVMSG